MNAAAQARPPGSAGARVVGFTQPYIERALRNRVRYRYVKPQVCEQGDAYYIVAPCCSRNVDPDGGVIDIAWFQRQDDGQWLLYARDHASATWVLQDHGLTLDQALDQVCVDSERKFWP